MKNFSKAIFTLIIVVMCLGYIGTNGELIKIGLMVSAIAGLLYISSDLLEKKGLKLSKVGNLFGSIQDRKRPDENTINELRRIERSPLGMKNLPVEIGRLRQRAIDYPSVQQELQKISNRLKVCRDLASNKRDLSRRVAGSIKIDEYGEVKGNSSAVQIERFINGTGISPNSRRELEDLKRLVKAQIYLANKKRELIGFDISGAPLDGIEFEYWVAEMLTLFGWKTKVSKGSGDQGLDVSASKRDIKAGIQCKRYQKNVSISAVQQSYSAKKHFNLTHSVVVTTSGYTKSAKEVARSNDVLLITHDQLPDLEKMITNR